MEDIKPRNKKHERIIDRIKVSLVWVVIIAAAVGTVKYGEYQYSKGMLEGFQKASDSINVQVQALQKTN